jgi:HK97 gp10 family phage protein
VPYGTGTMTHNVSSGNWVSWRVEKRKLNNLRRNAKGQMTIMLRTIGRRVEATAKALAPVETGALRDSIHMNENDTGTRGGGMSAVLGIAVGSDLDYSRWQELGTSVMPAHPYLIPAYEQHTQDIGKQVELFLVRLGMRG